MARLKALYVSNRVSLWYNLQHRIKCRILGALRLVKSKNFSTRKKIAKNGEFVEKYARIQTQIIPQAYYKRLKSP